MRAKTQRLHRMVILLALCFALIDCSTTPVTPINPSVDYKYDMTGSVNGMGFNGVGVIRYASTYHFKLLSKVDVDLLTITSCHRDFSVESAIRDDGWFQKRRGYEYDYTPVPGIEDKGSCLVRIGEYNKGQGRVTLAVLDFETPEETLSVTNDCNGEIEVTNGTSICQAKVGLLQKLEFKVPVRISPNLEDRCKPSPDSTNKVWTYYMPAGECAIAFQEIDGTKRLHRHTTLGYSDIFIRGN